MKQNRRYKNFKKMDKQTKKILILFAVIIVLMIISNLLVNKSVNKPNENNENSFSSIKQIIENFGCTYIKEEKSKDKNYSLDIYLDFKFNTFEGKESKQRSYENIIGNLYQFISSNFRLIDEEKNLTIEVIGNTNSDIVSYYYLINGQENYFENEKSKLSLNNYEEDKKTKLDINSEIISGLIENKWNTNINFGTKESTFENYDIYFDEGIEVRKIAGKVFNIIFTNKHSNEIVNGIKVGETNANIIKKLGMPTYGKEDSSIIGYQSEDIYIFFSNSEISIYRNEKTDTKEFEKLLSKYVEKEIDIKEFMNELTYLWDDYEKYNYSADSIYITYPLKGIEISMTTDNSLGIRIYNNCNITEKISELIKTGKITGNLDENLLEKLILEKEELYEQYIYIANLQDYEAKNKKIESNLYYDCVQENKVLFMSKDSKNPNKEIKEHIGIGLFINDYIYVYSVEQKGIYAFNVLTEEKTTLITGTEEFKIEKYENQILKYDDKELKIVME